MWTESATQGFHLGTELSKHDFDSSSNLISTPGFGIYVKLQTWDPTNPRRQDIGFRRTPRPARSSVHHPLDTPAPARRPWPGSPPPRRAAGAGLASAAGDQRRPPPDTTLSRFLHTGFGRAAFFKSPSAPSPPRAPCRPKTLAG